LIVGLTDPDDKSVTQLDADERPQAISFCAAIKLPGVISVIILTLLLSHDMIITRFQYSLAYACLKMVNYSFFFWLPFYLLHNFGWSESVSDSLSTWYDWGGIVGGLIGGLITVYTRIIHI
jgi:OPA family glycerol-3-phosphate transporter-like MFS transporter 3